MAEKHFDVQQRERGVRNITGHTQRNRGDLCIQIQHPVAISIHQVVSPALLIITEEINCTHVL